MRLFLALALGLSMAFVAPAVILSRAGKATPTRAGSGPVAPSAAPAATGPGEPPSLTGTEPHTTAASAPTPGREVVPAPKRAAAEPAPSGAAKRAAAAEPVVDPARAPARPAASSPARNPRRPRRPAAPTHELRARAEFYAKLGDSLREDRDYDSAIANYQRALRLDPTNFAAISGRERARALRSLDQ